jgi:hypothetical protein
MCDELGLDAARFLEKLGQTLEQLVIREGRKRFELAFVFHTLIYAAHFFACDVRSLARSKRRMAWKVPGLFRARADDLADS